MFEERDTHNSLQNGMESYLQYALSNALAGVVRQEAGTGTRKEEVDRRLTAQVVISAS
jgi:hypothetical protein